MFGPKKWDFLDPKGGIVEAQSHLLMPPVSSSMHAHARSCAYVCTRACTFGAFTFGAKFVWSCCPVLVLGCSKHWISACVHISLFMYSQGGLSGGLRALNKTDPGPVGQRVPSKKVVLLCMCAPSFWIYCACHFVS